MGFLNILKGYYNPTYHFLYKYWYLFDENKTENALLYLRHLFMRAFLTDNPNPKPKQMKVYNIDFTNGTGVLYNI